MTLKRTAVIFIIVFFLLTSGKFFFASNFKDFGYFFVHSHSMRLYQNPYDEASRLKIREKADYPHTASVAHYPPFLFFVLSFFTNFSFYAAARSFFILNVILYFFSAFYFIKNNQDGLKIILITLIFFIPDFAQTNLAAGQVNILALFFIILTKYFYDKNMPLAAGAALAAASIIKIIPVIFIVYFILKKEHKVTAGFLAVLLIFLILPEFVVQRGITVSFFSALSSKLGSDSLSPISYSLPALFNNYFSPMLASKVFYAFIAAVLIKIALLFYNVYFKNKKINNNLFYCLFLVMILFSSFVSKQHYIFTAPFYAYFLTSLKNKNLLFFLAFCAAVTAAPVEFAGLSGFLWIKYTKIILILISFILVFYNGKLSFETEN